MHVKAAVADDQPVRGLVRRPTSVGEFQRRVWPVDSDLSFWVDYLWTVEWHRPGEPPLRSTVISDPNIHLTAEWGDDQLRHGVPMPATLVHGVVTEVFEVSLGGSGGVVGVRFRPEGFAAWAGVDASTLTGRVLPAEQVLGPPYAQLHEAAQAAPDARARAALMAEALRHYAPRSVPPDRQLLGDLVARMASDETLTRVEQLVEVSGWTMRTLQRRFRRDVGVGPKWVLARFRLQSAALALEQDPGVDLAQLAVRLGWYDQAHLTNDFRRMLGETPGEYAVRAAGRSPA